MGALLGSLAEKGLGLLITVDEVDPNVDELAELVSTYQLFVREDRMIALLLAGLPGKTLALLNKGDITFLRRAKRYNLETIPDSSVMEAFADTVRSNGKRIGVDALEVAADAIGGFAFMMQAVGYRAWDSSSAEELTVANVREGAAIARRELEDSVLESTYLELTRGDRAFVEAMLEDGKGSFVADIGKRTGKSRNSIQKTRRWLIDLGVIGERGRGVVAFELPYFREYLKKQLGE